MAIVLILPGTAQNGPPLPRPQPQAIGQPAGDSIYGPGSGDPFEEEERLRALNNERHKSLVSDTNKLLKLAGELDMEVKREDAESLTPSELRKWAAIEKLAHNVKEKMSFSVRGVQVLQPPPPIR
jgi:hypothetical protein